MPYVIAVNSFALVNSLFGEERVLHISLVMQSLERRIRHFDFYALVNLFLFIYGLSPSPVGIAGPIPAGAWTSVCCECCVLSEVSASG